MTRRAESEDDTKVIRIVETDWNEYRALRTRVNHALQHLWTRYAKTPGYNKDEWRELGNAISALEIIARRTTGNDMV